MIKKLKPISREDIVKIRFYHLIVAFLLALLIPALWAAVEWNSYQFHLYQTGKGTFEAYFNMLQRRFKFLYIVGLFLAGTFGIPAFYILRKFLPFKFSVVCLVAAIIAVLPNAVIEILQAPGDGGGYTIGQCKIIENGRRTLCGWQHFWIDNILMVALQGALAGAVFWLVLVKMSRFGDRP